MENKEKMVEELKHKQKEKKYLKIGAVILVLAAAVGLFMHSNISAPGLDNLNNQQTIEYAETVQISTGIRPYRSNILSNETLRIKNNRGRTVNVTFETNEIEENIEIEANQSGYFDASNYENLPTTNYFNLDSGDTGEIVVNEVE